LPSPNHKAAQDETLLKTVHRLAGVQRVFLSLFLKRPSFDIAVEMRTPESLAEVEQFFGVSHSEKTYIDVIDLHRDRRIRVRRNLDARNCCFITPGVVTATAGRMVGNSEKARSGFPRKMPIPATWLGNALLVDVPFWMDRRRHVRSSWH
jgi:hypothetical protein